ncbi:response regulator [Flavobacterium sp. LB2P74]|uniref:response regulator n=1 Tax=Flavobacterium sp. LB2P74 TaxID=3401717 RepID=UPI003AAFDFB9
MKNELEAKFGKVIIVDDNPIERYCSSRMILNNNFGKQVIEFSLASKALAYLVENQEKGNQLPEVIFIDLYMPHFSGFEFLEAYDKLPFTLKNKVKVFIVSNTIEDLDITRVCRDPNVVSFHQKPIIKEFLDRIIPD